MDKDILNLRRRDEAGRCSAQVGARRRRGLDAQGS